MDRDRFLKSDPDPDLDPDRMIFERSSNDLNVFACIYD